MHVSSIYYKAYFILKITSLADWLLFINPTIPLDINYEYFRESKSRLKNERVLDYINLKSNTNFLKYVLFCAVFLRKTHSIKESTKCLRMILMACIFISNI